MFRGLNQKLPYFNPGAPPGGIWSPLHPPPPLLLQFSVLCEKGLNKEYRFLKIHFVGLYILWTGVKSFAWVTVMWKHTIFASASTCLRNLLPFHASTAIETKNASCHLQNLKFNLIAFLKLTPQGYLCNQYYIKLWFWIFLSSKQAIIKQNITIVEVNWSNCRVSNNFHQCFRKLNNDSFCFLWKSLLPHYHWVKRVTDLRSQLQLVRKMCFKCMGESPIRLLECF